MIERIVMLCRRRKLLKPYVSPRSDVGFKAIGKSSELRTLPLTEGKVYLPHAYKIARDGGYTDFFITVEGGVTTRVTQSDIGTLFRVIAFPRLPICNNETEDYLM